MSGAGQKRRFDRRPVTSGLPRLPATRLVPFSEVGGSALSDFYYVRTATSVNRRAFENLGA